MNEEELITEEEYKDELDLLKFFKMGLIAALIPGIFMGVFIGLGTDVCINLSFGLLAGLIAGLIGGLAFMCLEGLILLLPLGLISGLTLTITSQWICLFKKCSEFSLVSLLASSILLIVVYIILLIFYCYKLNKLERRKK